MVATNTDVRLEMGPNFARARPHYKSPLLCFRIGCSVLREKAKLQFSEQLKNLRYKPYSPFLTLG